VIAGSIRPLALHVVPSYLPRSETFIYSLIRSQRRYAAAVAAGWIEQAHVDEFPFEPIIELLPPGRPLSQRIVSRAGASLRRKPLIEPPLARSLRRIAPDVVHAHFGWMGEAAARSMAGGEPRPLITSFYGRDLADTRGTVYAALFEMGTLFFVEGPNMAAQLEGIGCKSAAIRLVRIGVELPHMRTRKAGASGFVMMQVARFVEKKGVDLTIRAFAGVLVEIPGAELWLVGDGPLRLEMETLVDELGVRDCVHFTGMVSHAEYGQLMERVDVCIQPSRTAADGDSEGGAPTVLLEMQARGIPIVSTRHADIPFVVAHPADLVDEEDVDGLVRAVLVAARRSARECAEWAKEARMFVERNHERRAVTQVVEQHYDEARALYAGNLGSRRGGSGPSA
jgi:colanic acid/amylovoran biosynthesis glycosyltransferase